MKNVFMVSLLALLTIAAFGQKEASDTLDFNRVKEHGYISSFKNSHLFKAMKMPDASYLNVGDEVTIGMPSSLNTSKQANPGLFSGNVITVSAFNYITFGRLGMSVLAGMQYLDASYTKKKVIIKEIKRGWTIIDLTGNSNLGTITDVLEAINTGEIINPNAAITRDQAIAKIKEAKDLLDLGLMSKEDFEKLKEELSKIIMQKKN